MSSRLEWEDEGKFCRRVRRELFVHSIKLNLQGNRGWPDRMFLLPGKPVFIEFKRRGEHPSDLQLYRIKQLTALGYDALWTSDYDLAWNWITNLLTTRLSEAGHQVDDWTGLRGVIPRPRTGEN